MILPKERDPRFITLRRGGTLEDADHRLLALWAAECAEHVLPLFEAERPADTRPRQAIEHARAWARGEVTMSQARTAAGKANTAARDLSGAARHAAYAAAQAAVVAHVAAHELGAAAYAIKAARAAAPTGEGEHAGREECRWQRERLPEEIRELVLDDQRRRNAICWSVFVDSDPRYFTLTLESLRAISGWTADCAERALPVFAARASSDPRLRAAIDGIREFAGGGKRAARLRVLAMQAHAAAREVGDPAAAAAARAAGSAAASAYMHPLRDVHQTKHVVGAAAYAALALELDGGGDPGIGDAEVFRAIETAPVEAREVLLEMPPREPGTSRLDALLYELDAGIRGRDASGAGPSGAS